MKKSSILDFFKCQSAVIKVNCPACNLLVYKTNLNVHLDHNCSSAANDFQLESSRSCAESNPIPKKNYATSSKLNLKSQRKKKSEPATGEKLSNPTSKNDSDDDVVILDEVSSSINVSSKVRNDLNSSKSLIYSLPGRNDSKLIVAKQNEEVEITQHVQITKNSYEIASHTESTTLKRNSKRSGKASKSHQPRKLLKTEAPESETITYFKVDDALAETSVLSSQTEKNELSNDILHLNSEVSSCRTFAPLKEAMENGKIVSNNSGDNSNKEPIDACKKLESSNSKSQIESFEVSKELADVKQCLEDMSAFSELSDSNEKEGNGSTKKVYTPYYIANFRHILDCVLKEEDNKILFNEEDTNFVEAFNSLSDTSQKLYVRLFQRKYKWLRCDKINYPDITTNPFISLEELCKSRLVDSGSSDTDLETALNLLSLPEAKLLAKHFNFNSAKNKEEIKSMLIKHSKQHKSVFFMNGQNSISKMILKKVRQTVGPCYRLSLIPKKLFTRILMLFNLTLLSEDDDDSAAGGQQQQLLTLLQVNKGDLIFPDYKRTKEIAIFANRDELIRYEEARQFETDILVAVEHKKFERAKELFIEAKEEYEDQLTKDYIERASSLPVFLKRYTPYHVYIRCMTQGVEILQRLREYKEAVSLLRSLLHQNVFCQDYKGRWYDRLALNLEQHLKKPQEALKEIKNALADKNVRKGHRYSLLVRALRLTKSLDDEDGFRNQILREADVIEAPKVVIKGRLCPRAILGRRHVFISSSSICSNEDDITVVGVEQLTLEHYKEDGYPKGIHGEGSTFISLYALLFWDIIYDGSIPDVFICPFQTHPLDLNSDLFFLNREQQITSHLETLKQVSNEDLKEIVKTTWENHHGKASLVTWDRFVDLEHVQGLVACLGSQILSGICERLAKDFRFTRSGVPDLVVWNPETLKVKIVEVKGPGDKLSSKQILWLDYLIKLGADAEVCLVEAEASKKLRK